MSGSVQKTPTVLSPKDRAENFHSSIPCQTFGYLLGNLLPGVVVQHFSNTKPNAVLCFSATKRWVGVVGLRAAAACCHWCSAWLTCILSWHTKNNWMQNTPCCPDVGGAIHSHALLSICKHAPEAAPDMPYLACPCMPGQLECSKVSG